MEATVPRRGAFGLPEGTIRAVLALSAIFTCSACVLLKITIPDWFIGLVGQIVTFYFIRERAHGG